LKLLLHSCCGPCSIYPIETLLSQNYDIEGLFYNPNIHPYTEYKQRMDAAKHVYNKYNLNLNVIDEYNISNFIKNCAFKESDRCKLCYTLRLHRAAKEAKEKGFDAFTTSLLVSPYQKHEFIKQVGEEAAEQNGVNFLYFDFREGFREGQAKAREMDIYRQKYCGCIFSEEERYLGKK
jgi:predicted adenine nucleotide alpha hydrolase (AANH) superfamily ATPase